MSFDNSFFINSLVNKIPCCIKPHDKTTFETD